MIFSIAVEWSYDLGLDVFVVLDLTELIEDYFKGMYYGPGINSIGIVLICRPTILKTRKRFLKEKKQLEFDVILPFELIKSATVPEKKQIIKQELLANIELILNNYKFNDFDSKSLIGDLKRLIMSGKWD